MKNSSKSLEAAKLLFRRRQARKSFWSFCQYINSSFFTEDKQHLRQLADALQKVSEDAIKKLMISLPPRSGKSYTVSLWCAWTIGRDPASSIMRNSYGQTLAEKFSYDIRDIIKTDKYLFVFPNVKLKDDKRRIDDWAVIGAEQSSYFCAGVGGAITGKGCKTAAILDDPIKNLEDALSETILDKTWTWYTSTHKSRMETGCPEIQIATRWSKKDPIGMLTDKEAKDWQIISIPALTKDGKSFCESIKTTEEYLKEKELLDDFIWEAEYMQNPVESKGLLFPPSELQRYSEQNDYDSIIGYVDTADEGADSLFSGIAKIKGEFVYVDDVIFTQEPIEITEALVAQQIIDNNPDEVMVESNSGGKSFARNVEALIKEHNKKVLEYNSDRSNTVKMSLCRTTIKKKPTTQNKETRILMKSGQIKKYFKFKDNIKPGSDYDRYFRELTSYVKLATNKHDDAADGTTGIAEMLLDKSKLKAVLSL